MDLPLADIDAGDLRVEVAPILFGQADIVGIRLSRSWFMTPSRIRRIGGIRSPSW